MKFRHIDDDCLYFYSFSLFFAWHELTLHLVNGECYDFL